jgi:thioredoxin reductase (NADPH)
MPTTKERTLVAMPLFLVVADEQQTREGLCRDLERRFRDDYRVLKADSGRQALTTLRGLGPDAETTALLIVDERLADMTAVSLFQRARSMCRRAKRVLLVRRGNWSAEHPVVSALALGQIDYHLYSPWHPLERILYPAVAEFLAAWEKTSEPAVAALRIVGDEWSPRSHALRDVLTRVGVPYWFYPVESEAGQQLLAAVGEDGSRRPVAVYLDGRVLVDPSHAELMATLGVKTRLDAGRCDVAVLGAGPAGLSAAVYAASEGLATVVVEPVVPGGQAGTSSLIRNYLGFHRGISGDDLTNRAVEQAWLFGVDFVLSQTARAILTRGDRRVIRTSGGDEVEARAVIVATGVAWRRLGVASLEELIGAGVYYGAAGAEARAMQGRAVYVVGAGNSAGQAVLHLARYAASVTMLVRGDSLSRTMSDYLVTEIEQNPTVQVRLRSEVVGGGGPGYLESLRLRTRGEADDEVVEASALFVMIGAEPRTEWLDGVVARDERGYVLTGPDLLPPRSPVSTWPLERPPRLMESSCPGVFAVGDVRHGSVKRVASAVGSGAIAMQLVHEYLAEVGDP